MTVKKFVLGELGENCYALISGNDAIVIDPGEGAETVSRYLADNALACRYVLLTHAHFDHASGAADFKKSGAEVYMHEAERAVLETDANLARLFGREMPRFTCDRLLVDGERLSLCGLEFTVIHTPGHTAGSVCYAFRDCIFTGDTLFFQSVGRTDFPTGDGAALISSLKNKLFKLPHDYKLYCGHGPESSLFYEKENNFLC